MLKLTRIPGRDGYTVDFDTDARAARVRGRLPRGRLDQQDSASRVAVNFTLKPSEHDAFMAFYEQVNFTGEEFLVDLITGDFELREHTCRLVPGSLRTVGSGGVAVAVGFELEADHLSDLYTSDFDNNFMDIYETNPEGDPTLYELLAKLVNEDLPE